MIIDSITPVLFVSTSVLFALLTTHQRFIDRAVGIQASFVLGAIASTGIFIFHGIVTHWYSPLVLFAICSVFGGTIGAVMDNTMGAGKRIAAGYVWPLFAILSAAIINRM